MLLLTCNSVKNVFASSVDILVFLLPWKINLKLMPFLLKWIARIVGIVCLQGKFI